MSEPSETRRNRLPARACRAAVERHRVILSELPGSLVEVRP